MPWNKSVSESRVRAAIAQLKSVTVKDLTREVDLATAEIPLDQAYRVDGVHAYVEIVNAHELLHSDASEGERCHKRFLRFLHLFQRIVHTGVLATTDVFKVDHQNHRVHLILYKPYDDAAKRIAVMVAVVEALRALLLQANKHHDELPDARVRAGIETGVCLAVRNGTRGDRELLFLGNAANHAAKLLAGTRDGIYLGATARAVLGADFAAKDAAAAPLSDAQITACRTASGLTLDVEELLKQWKAACAATPLAEFSFTRPKPPLADLDLDTLTPANSRRIEAAAIMADVDRFTAYVARSVTNLRDAGEAIRVLHVIRKELRDVLNDFGGSKVRYIGDCVQGVLAEGETSTDYAETVAQALWCAAALRDAFGVIQKELPAAASLGLAIGLDLGWISLTRLGVRGSRDRCVAGRAMLSAEACQRRCSGVQTAVGNALVAGGSDKVKRVFAKGQMVDKLDTNTLDALLREAETKVGREVTDASGAKVTLPKAYGR